MAIGDLGPILDGPDVVDATGRWPAIIHVAGQIYAVAYEGDGNDGYITTVDVSDDGTINDAQVERLEFDTDHGASSSILHIAGTVYAVAYSGPGTTGYCKTINIPASGVGMSVIATKQIDTGQCFARQLNFFHISGNVYAFCYQGVNAVTISTWEIEDNGTLGAVLNKRDFPVTQNKGIDFVHITGNIYAFSHSQLENDTVLHTCSIANDGTIGAEIDSLTLGGASGDYKPRIVHVNGTVYLVTYIDAWPAFTCTIKTVDIDASGNITLIDTDTAILPDGSAPPYDVKPLASNVYIASLVITGGGPVYTGAVWTWTVDDDGTIGAKVDDLATTIHTSSGGNVIQIAGNVWIQAISAQTVQAQIVTFNVGYGGKNQAYLSG